MSEVEESLLLIEGYTHIWIIKPCGLSREMEAIIEGEKTVFIGTMQYEPN